jgi:uncharacterized protein YndB with AHSA1/START domain
MEVLKTNAVYSKQLEYTWNHHVNTWKILQLEFSMKFRNQGTTKSTKAKTSGTQKATATYRNVIKRSFAGVDQ